MEQKPGTGLEPRPQSWKGCQAMSSDEIRLSSRQANIAAVSPTHAPQLEPVFPGPVMKRKDSLETGCQIYAVLLAEF